MIKTPNTPAKAQTSTVTAEATSLQLASFSGGDELVRLKAELEQVRKERDQLQLMHSLRDKEEELKRAIEVREMG